MIASANVINMNARIYDPAIARFTSPDTIVPDSTNPMAHNRYIYVYNNPIKYVDPNGHNPLLLFFLGAAIFTIGATSDDSVIRTIGTVAGSLIMMYGAGVFDLSQAGFTAENMGAIATRAGGVGFTSGYISSGGDLGEAFKSGFFSAVGAAVSYGIGHGSWFSGSKEAVLAQQALAHGVSQGAISEMRGGNFKSGFIGGFLGKISGGLAETMFDDKVAQYIAVTMIGGAVSEAAGGDFLEGAVAAAMVHLFNDMQAFAAGQGAKAETNSVLKETDMNPSGRRIVASTVGGAVKGAVVGCAAGLPVAGVGCFPGAVAGAIAESAKGMLIGTAIEISGWGQPIEDVIGASLGTAIGYTDYTIRNITQ